jgi:hypothetical protein
MLVTDVVSGVQSVYTPAHEHVDDFVVLPVRTTSSDSPVLPDEKTFVQSWQPQTFTILLSAIRCGDGMELEWDTSLVSSSAVCCDVMRVELRCETAPQIPLLFPVEFT